MLLISLRMFQRFAKCGKNKLENDIACSRKVAGRYLNIYALSALHFPLYVEELNFLQL